MRLLNARRSRHGSFRIHSVIAIIAVFGLGVWLGGVLFARQPAAREHSAAAAPEQPAQIWTCSMHPQIRAEKPGLCPICGMELVPVAQSASGDDTHPRRFSVDAAARELMHIQVVPVERKFVTAKIRMVGKIAFDETRLATITAWAPGRLERLFVDYTGIQVKRGDHLVSIYSPELLTAEQELRSAVQAVKNLRDGAPEMLRTTGEATLAAARGKLKRWGLTEDQIRDAETKGALSDRITIFAPIGGTVIERMGVEGAYVEVGMPIYRIADLSRVWVLLEAYESDLAWLHFGQTVSFTAEAYPGEKFTGKIAFIDPVLDDKTRTVKVRVNVSNEDGRLKPEMFVRAVVEAQIATGGRVMDPGLAGKWISPMHPEIVKNGPGTCDICGMPLVKAEDLGYVALQAGDADKPLVIPASAPLITGTRAVVYVEVLDADPPAYDGREIELGPRAGDYYLVKSGLEEGERVVVNGNFKIDSALQILAKPSMMTPPEQLGQEGETAAGTPEQANVPMSAPALFLEQLGAAAKTYDALQIALAADDVGRAQAALPDIRKSLDAVDMSLVMGDAHETWMKHLKAMQDALNAAAQAGTDLAKLRAAFDPLSTALIQAIRAFGLPENQVLYALHCPMAFDNRGADWLQTSQEVRNPYFGAAMPHCGKITEAFGQGEKKAAAADSQEEKPGHE